MDFEQYVDYRSSYDLLQIFGVIVFILILLFGTYIWRWIFKIADKLHEYLNRKKMENIELDFAEWIGMGRWGYDADRKMWQEPVSGRQLTTNGLFILFLEQYKNNGYRV